MENEKLADLHAKRRVYAETLDEQLDQLKSDPVLKRFAETRKKLDTEDPFRPLYHFSTPDGMLNDPNGLCFWNGKYHLFYQLHAEAEPRTHWGHAMSDDLIHWSDLPIAIYPSSETHSFSGNTCVEEDRVIAFYQGNRNGSMVATSNDPLLLNWEKNPNNPVIPRVETDDTGYPYIIGDPCIWKEEEGYFAVSGNKRRDSNKVPYHPTAHLFFSQDLSRWVYYGRLFDDEIFAGPDNDASCPYFLPFGDKYIYCYFSHKSSSGYYIGDYDKTERRFMPLNHGRFLSGEVMRGSIHAPSVFPDGNGACFALFNTKECLQVDGRIGGVMTLPRLFTLKEGNTLGIEPIDAVKTLRYDSKKLGSVSLPANEDIQLKEASGNAIEIEAEIEPREARMVCINVLQSPGKEEYTPICFYINTGGRKQNMAQVLIDPSRSSLRKDVFARIPEFLDVQLEEDNLINCRIFIDRSLIEVFINGKQCVTLMVHPSRTDSTGISLRAQGGDAQIKNLSVHQMSSIWG